MERELGNDYDEWLRQQGGDPAYGGTIPTNPYVPAPVQSPDMYYNHSNVGLDHSDGPGGAASGGKTPAQIEAEGRAYDQANGLVGGYMMDGRWVNGSPYKGGRDTNPGSGFDFGNLSAPSSGSWNWPVPDFPHYGGYAEFDAGDPFTPERYTPNTFAAPTMQDAENEPGYAFARDQGRKALETSAAARGTLRSGGTLKDILQFGNKFAEQNYGNVFNRSRDIFNTNEGNRFDAFKTNEGNRFSAWAGNNANRLGAWNANKDLSLQTHDRNYKESFDEFGGKQRQSELEFADVFNRFQAQLNALTSLSQPVG